MEHAVIVFKVIVVAVAVIAILGVAVCLLSSDECDDSPDGTHHYFAERTPTGTAARCEWCCKLTSGIEARWG